MLIPGTEPPIASAARPSLGTHPWRDLWPTVVIVLAYLPLLALYGRVLWSSPYYHFFPLLIPGAAVIVARTCLRLGPLEPGSASMNRLLGTLAWLALAVAVLV